MSCYFFARIVIHDAKAYQRYLAGTDPVLKQYQAEVLAVDEHPVVLEGEFLSSRAVLIRFPDRGTAASWYHSPEYRAIVRYRHQAAEADAILVNGRDEPLS